MHTDDKCDKNGSISISGTGNHSHTANLEERDAKVKWLLKSAEVGKPGLENHGKPEVDSMYFGSITH